MPDNSYQYIPLATMKDVMKMYVEDILMVMCYINILRCNALFPFKTYEESIY